jgi:hypothetical protein
MHTASSKLNAADAPVAYAPVSYVSTLAATDQATLVRTIDTSKFSVPSPDPAGITYLASSARLLVSDSEVDEMSIFAGDNLFAVSLPGSLLDTWSTLPFSKEPTGIVVNPSNGHLFYSDDSLVSVGEIDPGPDKQYSTADDVVTFLDVKQFGSFDPEGVAFDTKQKHLLTLDDTNQEVYEVSPGENGKFDGLLPYGDDHVTSYDLSTAKLLQIKGVTYDPASGHLYVVGRPRTKIVETTMTGIVVRTIDVSAILTGTLTDLTLAPSSLDPDSFNLYITDGGVDNDVNPDENDGKIYEVALPPVVPFENEPPTVDAGPNRTLVLPESSVLLDATVTDDGLPAAPGALKLVWSQLQGPRNVNFSDISAPDTKVTIPAAGVYVLRLLADDGVAVSSDTVTVTVSLTNTAPVVDAGSDQSWIVGQIVTLVGNVTDDGLPNPPGAITSTWELQGQTDGAMVVDAVTDVNEMSMIRSGQYVLGVSFSKPGEYLWRLTANDGVLEAHDDVVVSISAAVPRNIFLPLITTKKTKKK